MTHTPISPPDYFSEVVVNPEEVQTDGDEVVVTEETPYEKEWRIKGFPVKK